MLRLGQMGIPKPPSKMGRWPRVLAHLTAYDVTHTHWAHSQLLGGVWRGGGVASSNLWFQYLSSKLSGVLVQLNVTTSVGPHRPLAGFFLSRWPVGGGGGSESDLDLYRVSRNPTVPWPRRSFLPTAQHPAAVRRGQRRWSRPFKPPVPPRACCLTHTPNITFIFLILPMFEDIAHATNQFPALGHGTKPYSALSQPVLFKSVFGVGFPPHFPAARGPQGMQASMLPRPQDGPGSYHQLPQYSAPGDSALLGVAVLLIFS